MADVVLLGLDPGFASFGYAVCALGRGATGARALRVSRMGLLRTEKSAKKRQVLAVEDNVRRCAELVRGLDELLRTTGARVVCAEAFSPPRSSSVASKVALAWGVLVSLTTLRGIPVLQASPQEVKKAVAGKQNASKEEIQEAIAQRFGSNLRDRVYDADGALMKAVTRLEHPYDALAVALACLEAPVVRALWSGVGGGDG